MLFLFSCVNYTRETCPWGVGTLGAERLAATFVDIANMRIGFSSMDLRGFKWAKATSLQTESRLSCNVRVIYVGCGEEEWARAFQVGKMQTPRRWTAVMGTRMCLMPLNRALKTVKMVNFM